VRIACTLDCCDREAIPWVATTGGVDSGGIRDLMIESPQSNGMAQAFVKTLKRDYARVSPCPNAATVRRQLDGWFGHYDTVHPHKAPGYRSPREFREQTSDSATALRSALGVDRMTAQRLRRRSGQARQPRAARRRKASILTQAQPWTTHEKPNPVRLFRGNYTAQS
jgi:hypothetical protein